MNFVVNQNDFVFKKPFFFLFSFYTKHYVWFVHGYSVVYKNGQYIMYMMILNIKEGQKEKKKKHSSLWGGLMWSKLPLWEEYKYIQNTDFFIAENNNCFFFIVIVLLLTTCMQILTSQSKHIQMKSEKRIYICLMTNEIFFFKKNLINQCFMFIFCIYNIYL